MRFQASRRIGADYLELVVIAGGPRLTLRPLVPSDATILEEGLLGLSPDSRYMRFLSPRTAFTPGELRHLTDVDGERHVALGAFSRGNLVGEARFIRPASDDPSAEVALAIDDLHQQQGIATLLLSRLRIAGIERGITRFTGLVLMDNRAMLCLLRKLGARLGLPSLGVYEPVLTLS